MERSDLMIKSLAVYCGAHLGNDPIYQARAAAFGKKMAQNGIELVYGGGKYGTMGVIANAILDNGGKVHGVITRQLYERQTALDRVEDLKIVSNMDVRKDLMMGSCGRTGGAARWNRHVGRNQRGLFMDVLRR